MTLAMPLQNTSAPQTDNIIQQQIEYYRARASEYDDLSITGMFEIMGSSSFSKF